MDIKHLKYFVAIVDFGSISKAASHLGLAQSALSQQLSQLETELRGILLIRHQSGVTPTDLGRGLYKHGRIVLNQMEQAEEELHQTATGCVGTVSIGLPTTTALPLGLPLLKAARQKYPGIRLQIFESLSGYIAELIANYRLDIGILFRDRDTRTLSVTPLILEQIFVLGDCGLSRSVRTRATCELSDLRGVPLILPSHRHELRALLEHTFAGTGLDADVVADVDSLAIMVGAARDGIACTLLPISMLQGIDAAHTIAARLLTLPGIERPISLCMPKSVPYSPASTVIAELIKELVPQLVEAGQWPGVTPFRPRITET